MKISKPFFSIITCTLNSEKYLSKNLNSVREQTFKDFEQIIIDGVSRDNTVNIIRSFLNKDARVKMFPYPPKGISNAFNMGIRHSNGIYLLFLNSDDYLYDKNVLRDIYIFLGKNPKLDWIYGKISVIEENGKSVGIFPKWKIFQISWGYLLKYINFVPHQAVFMKKDVFDQFGKLDVSLKTNMDYDLWLRISKKTNWGFRDRLISNYMIRKGSGSSDSDKRNQNLTCLETVQKRHLNYFEMILAKIVNRLVMKVNKTYR